MRPAEELNDVEVGLVYELIKIFPAGATYAPERTTEILATTMDLVTEGTVQARDYPGGRIHLRLHPDYYREICEIAKQRGDDAHLN